jgi:hypothetical protein
MLFDKEDNLRFTWYGAVIGLIIGALIGVVGGSDDAIMLAISGPFLWGVVIYFIKQKQKNSWVDKVIEDSFAKSQDEKQRDSIPTIQFDSREAELLKREKALAEREIAFLEAANNRLREELEAERKKKK